MAVAAKASEVVYLYVSECDLADVVASLPSLVVRRCVRYTANDRAYSKRAMCLLGHLMSHSRHPLVVLLTSPHKSNTLRVAVAYLVLLFGP